MDNLKPWQIKAKHIKPLVITPHVCADLFSPNSVNCLHFGKLDINDSVSCNHAVDKIDESYAKDIKTPVLSLINQYFIPETCRFTNMVSFPNTKLFHYDIHKKKQMETPHLISAELNDLQMYIQWDSKTNFSFLNMASDTCFLSGVKSFLVSSKFMKKIKCFHRGNIRIRDQWFDRKGKVYQIEFSQRELCSSLSADCKVKSDILSHGPNDRWLIQFVAIQKPRRAKDNNFGYEAFFNWHPWFTHL